MLDDRDDLFGDEAVFQRTIAGQHELISPSGQLDRLESWLLAAVTGHTPLRMLTELCSAAPTLHTAAATLHARGLVECIADEPLRAN